MRVQGNLDPPKNDLFYLHADHLSSASLTTDSNGSMYSENCYYSYSQVRYRVQSLGRAWK